MACQGKQQYGGGNLKRACGEAGWPIIKLQSYQRYAHASGVAAQAAHALEIYDFRLYVFNEEGAGENGMRARLRHLPAREARRRNENHERRSRERIIIIAKI